MLGGWVQAPAPIHLPSQQAAAVSQTPAITLRDRRCGVGATRGVMPVYAPAFAGT